MAGAYSINGWAVFVVKETDRFRYGLFRSVRHSLSTGAEESMIGLGKEVPVLLLRNRERRRQFYRGGVDSWANMKADEGVLL